MIESVSVSVAKRLTAFRLRAMRDLALRTWETHYKHIPDDVRVALQNVINAVQTAEEVVLAWSFKDPEEK